MAERSKLIVQKRTSLKSQITHVTNLFDKGKLDETTLKLRMARLTDLQNAFEELNDELVMLEPNEGHEEEFTLIQDRFFQLAGRIEKHLNNANVSNTDVEAARDENRVNQSTPVTINKRRRIKVPEAPLPTVDGKFEGWLSFKNAFRNLIDSQRDRSKLSEFEKGKCEPSAKKKRGYPPNKAFVLNASRNCVACHNKRHPLYMCDKFKQLSIQKRIEVVKNAKLCYNCLRSHRGSPCKFSTCSLCQKRHNTLLHLDKYAATSKINTESSEAKTKTD